MSDTIDTTDKNTPESDSLATEKGLAGASEPKTGAVSTGAASGSDQPEEKAVTPPASLFEFIQYFYETKTPVSEKYRDYFKDLEDKLSGDEQDQLHVLAFEKDPEYGKTLSLAEFVLETSGKQNHRDKIMDFVQRVASNAGSLSMTGSNAVFQQWLDGNSAASDKLSIFFSNIEKITDGRDKKGNEKKLPQKSRHNLGCIAAMWLYHKDEASLPQLINHLMKTAMDLKGEAGKSVESSAFAFVASMVKSTNKKKFAYFVDYVGKNESRLNEQIRQSSDKNAGLSRRIAALVAEQQAITTELEKEQGNTRVLDAKVAGLEGQLATLEQQRVHDSVHHGAEIQSSDSQYYTVLKQLSDTLSLAKTAFERGPGKAHILEYQLDEMQTILRKELE